MRNRKGQRELKKRTEAVLDYQTNAGYADPTPYEAVKNIRKQQIAEIKAQLRRERETGAVA